MRIACLTPLYPPSIGGTQILTEQCARYFQRRGHAVLVVTSAAEHLDDISWKTSSAVRSSKPHETDGGIEIERHDYAGPLSFFHGGTYAVAYRTKNPALWHPRYRAFQCAFYHAAEMARSVERFKPDVVFCNPLTEYLTDLGLSLKKRLGVPAAYHLSLHAERHLFPKQELARLADFDAILTNTPYETDYLVKTGLDPKRIHLTGATFDVASFLAEQAPEADVVEKLKGKKFVLYFGRRESGKGADTLMEAFQKISPSFPDTHLVLAGRSTAHFDANYREKALAHPRIVLLEAVSEGSKKWLYRNALCYSMVSNIDSFGLVYFEAWFSGRPVIGADVGAQRGVIDDGRDGLLVPYGDPDALAAALKRLIESPDEAARMGEAGKAKARRLLGDGAVEEKMLGILETIAGRR